MGKLFGNSQTPIADIPNPLPPPSEPVRPEVDLFEKAVEFTLAQEGLYSAHPNDNGGRTMRGVTENVYREYRRIMGDTRPVDEAAMKAITADEAKRVAKKLFWNPFYDGLKSQAVATALFDWGWGHGPYGAQQMAQACANTLGASINVDGKIGPASIAAINKIDPKLFVLTYADMIGRWYASFVDRDPRQRVFLKGWMNRVNRLKALVQ